MKAATVLSIAFALTCTACGGGGGGDSPASSGGTVTSGGGPDISAPAITTQPASQSVPAGSSVTFSVAASGSSLSYQWRRNGAEIAGATAASYTLSSAALADNGSKFSVVVKNPGGQVASAEAVLTVSGITVLAGSIGEYGSSDGAGAAARFNGPSGVAVDGAGNVYAADFYNQTIRKISPAGQVTTLAGAAGLDGKTDGAGSSARFAYPAGIALDGAGNLYVTDSAYRLIRRITPAGAVTTVTQIPMGQNVDSRSTGLFQPGGIAVDGANNLYVTNGVGTRRIAPDGSYTVIEGVDTQDNVYGSIFLNIRGVTVSADGTAVVGSLENNVKRIDAKGSTVIAGTDGLQGYMARDDAGNVYVADYTNFMVRKIAANGTVTTVAGNGSRGTSIGSSVTAAIPAPRGIAVDANGVLYVAAGNAILRIQQP